MIRDDEKGITITGVEEHVETVKIPSSLTVGGVEYPVKMVDNCFLMDDQTVKAVIFPDSVDRIGYFVLANSSVENIILPDDLVAIGQAFAYKCSSLNKVEYEDITKGTKIRNNEIGDSCFSLANEE